MKTFVCCVCSFFLGMTLVWFMNSVSNQKKMDATRGLYEKITDNKGVVGSRVKKIPPLKTRNFAILSFLNKKYFKQLIEDEKYIFFLTKVGDVLIQVEVWDKNTKEVVFYDRCEKEFSQYEQAIESLKIVTLHEEN